jgi:hypothetical protein
MGGSGVGGLGAGGVGRQEFVGAGCVFLAPLTIGVDGSASTGAQSAPCRQQRSCSFFAGVAMT